MPLKATRRKQTGAITIDGTITLSDGTKLRVQRGAASDSLDLAGEEATVLERRILKCDFFGESSEIIRQRVRTNNWSAEPERPHVYDLDEAIVKYMQAKPRNRATAEHVEGLRAVIGGATPLADINQDTISAIREKKQEQAAARGKIYKESSLVRAYIVPLRAVMRVAAKRKMCDAPEFEAEKFVEGRLVFFLPSEAERFILAAPQHMKPLLVFLFCTGARISEALYLEWVDVDLVGGKVIFWADRTKSGRRRTVFLPPRAIAALRALRHRDGMVFRTNLGRPYAEKKSGGLLRPTWGNVLARAGLTQDKTPHSTRHTWATWHYALHLDPKKLKEDGGWKSLDLVDRYAHVMPGGQVEAIKAFLGLGEEDANGALVGNAR